MSEQFKPPPPTLEERVALLEQIASAQAQVIGAMSLSIAKQVGVNMEQISFNNQVLVAMGRRSDAQAEK